MNRIYDAVYGYVELTDVEFELVKSPIFQRLHWIKQLGPLHTVFPSAQHSRFSHSIGVFHIMLKMIKHLKSTKSGNDFFKEIPAQKRKALRFAALLHDIGHVPLSHVGEKVLKNTLSIKKVDPKKMKLSKKEEPENIKTGWRTRFSEGLASDATKLHECLSAEIILNNEEIDQILATEEGWDNPAYRKTMKEQIALIVVGQPDNQVFRALLHSELDADRLDYLLRDSFFTGVDYGHIDLDYIISRFEIVKDDDGESGLCLDVKGLHTIEHYILARFFLHTQVIFNRRVKFLDLAFEDVMKYLILKVKGKKGLMGLDEYLKCIRKSKSKGRRKNQHRICEYTDAQVYMNMRKLHDDLDKELKEAEKNPSKKPKDFEEKSYINDCTKIIMDGKIPDPVETHQKLISVCTLEENERIDKLEEEANLIAKGIAEANGIYPERIKACVMRQNVMKHTERSEDEAEEDRLEAVKVVIERDGSEVVKSAAESTASILGGLVDKSLLVFNVYYVSSGNDIPNIESVINDGFSEYIQKNFPVKNKPCGCEKGDHLCRIIRTDNGVSKAKKIVADAKYICRKCGGVAGDEKHLCDAVEIGG